MGINSWTLKEMWYLELLVGQLRAVMRGCAIGLFHVKGQ